MARIGTFLITALACLPVTAADLAPTGTLRATFLNNNPVQALVDAKTGEVTGPAADIVRELARRAGVPSLPPMALSRSTMGSISANTTSDSWPTKPTAPARWISPVLTC